MSLDPAAKVLLAELANAGRPALSDLPVAEARAVTRKLHLALAPPVAAVARTDDLRIPGPAADIALRVHRPAGEGPHPIVVTFHGGGWVLGSVEEHEVIARGLCARTPAVVVSVEYRLAPEHPYPAPLDDCYAATAWVSAHAAELGGDPARLAVGGDSAGGNLAAAVALAARDRGGPPIALQVLTYPALDATCSSRSFVDNGDGYLLTAETMRWFWGLYLGDRGEPHDPHVSPLLADDLRGLPPALVVTAEYDPLRDEGERFADRLRDAGVDASASRYDGMLHGFVGMPTVFPSAHAALEEAATVLRETLGGS